MRKKYRKLTSYLVLLVMGVGMVIFPIRDNGMGDGRGEEDDAAETNALPRVYAGSGDRKSVV